MKRILSLFLSIVLVLSAFSSVVSVASATDETYIIPGKFTAFDMNANELKVANGSSSDEKYISYTSSSTTLKFVKFIKSSTAAASNPVIDTTTFPGKKTIKIPYNQTNQPYMDISFAEPTKRSGGQINEYTGKVYVTKESSASWEVFWSRNVATMNGKLKANTWYEFNAKLDLTDGVNKLTVKYTQELSAASSAEGVVPHAVSGSVTCTDAKDVVTFLRVRSGSSGSDIYYRDLKLSYTEPSYKKAQIISVGENGVVNSGQNVISVKLSDSIPKITKNHILVVNSETNEPVEVDSITASNADGHTIDVTLKSNLAGWAEYDITINALAFGDNSKQITGSEDALEVTDITKHFETSKPPFATKGFKYTVSGDNFNAKGLVVNTTGTPKDLKLVLSSFNNAGEQVAIAPANYSDFNDVAGTCLEADISTADAEKFNFFIINNWTDKTPLLGVSDTVDANGVVISEPSVSGGALGSRVAAISAVELNHDTFKLSVRVDTKETKVADGILFVYKKGEALSDTNLPLYAKAVSTAADGTLFFDIPLSYIDYGEYTVEFVSASLASNLTDDFKRYTPEELLDARKYELLNDAISATTAAELKEILLGLNSAGETVNSNFDIFGADVDMTNYEAAYDRENIFVRMLSSVSALGDYDELVMLFEEASANQVQYEIENPTIMIESMVTTVADTTNTVNYSGASADWSGTQALMTDGVKNTWLYITNNGADKLKTYEISNVTSFGGSVAGFKGVYPTFLEMFFGGKITAGTDISRNVLKGQKGTIEGRIRFESEVTPGFSFLPNGGYTDVQSLNSSLNADTWYNFKIDVVTGSHIFAEFIEAGTDNPHSISKRWNYTSDTFKYLRFYPRISAGEFMYLDDIKVYYDLIPYEKAKITSVGTAGVVEGYQNIVSLELSNRIPGLVKEHIIIKNNENGNISEVDSILVSDTNVNVVLNSNLDGWAEYSLTIDPLAFGDTALQRVGRGELTSVTALNSEFTTTKLPLAAKTFEFTKNVTKLNAKALVSNTSSVSKDMQFVFAGFDKSGRITNIVPTEHAGFSSGEEDFLEADISMNGSYVYNFFVIDNWTDKTPLFGANYTVDAMAQKVSAEKANGCDSIGTGGAVLELGGFDYDNIKITVKLDTKQSKPVDGILFVYKNGESLSSNNLPSYAKAVTTFKDGTLITDILLHKDIEYGEYIAEFVSDKLTNPVTSTFRYYSPSEILENKKSAIFSDAKAASSAESLQEALIGVNSSGEKVNNNFDIFGNDADMSDYNKNIDKLNVFTLMLPSVASVTDYNALVNLFESCAAGQRATEVASQKVQIVNNAKAATNSQVLMMVILGVDANDIRVNDNFEVISSNANMLVYKSLKNPSAVFDYMLGNMVYVNDYNSLIACFENAALTQQSKEFIKPSASSNNSSYGGSSTSMTKKVDVPVTPPGETAAVSDVAFKDMAGHWAQSYVEALYKRGIMNGYEDGSFRGNNSITRAEIAKTIVEAFTINGESGKTFADVKEDSWYSGFVARALAAGIVNGFEDGLFAPDKKVTRQDAALMIYRALSTKLKLPIGYTFFNDDLDIADYASGAIRTLGDLGIVTGNENKEFKPNNPITRAEIATMICRALDYVESH